MTERRFSRRDLLRAAGLTLFIPPFLRNLWAAEAELGPRLLVLMQANGTHQPNFWPKEGSVSSPILEPILGSASLQQKTLLVKGVVNRTVGLGNEHDRGFSGLWTGVAPVGTPDDCFAGGPSIDQLLKRRLAPPVLMPTLNCGVLAADVAPKNGHRRSFSYFGPKQQVATAVNPYRLHATLFGDGSASSDPARAARRVALRRSVLDFAARDLSELSARLGPAERSKLDAHSTAIREYEQRLDASLDLQRGACSAPSAPSSGLDTTLEDNVPRLTELMLELASVALACNLTRIVTFQLGYSGNQWRYRWLGIDKDGHEEIAHLDTLDGSNVAAAQAMTQISRWVAEHVARAATRLDAIPEAGGTVLDNSLVIWGNENGTGFHRLDNVPIVFLGRAAGRLQRTGVLDEGEQSHYQLNTSVLRCMGVEAAGFGDEPACGPLRGLHPA